MNTPIELVNAVEAYASGNRDSFNQVYELSYRYLHTCVMHVMKNEDATLDMLQETYLEISKSIGQLQNKEGFLNWAATIANRKCYAYLNKQKDVLLGESADEEAGDMFETIPDNEAFIPEAVLQDQEKQRLIKEIIDDLSDVQRLCVIGFYYNEQKQEEIAAQLGIPVNTVKSHLNRAKSKIKDAVVELDTKKGTRLYSIAPFMLLFFGMEAQASKAVPMPLATIQAGGQASAQAGVTAATVETMKVTGMALKTKIIIGAIIGCLAAGGTAIGFALSNKETDKTDLGEAYQKEIVEESDVSVESDPTEELTLPEETVEPEVIATDIEGLAISGMYDMYGYANEGLIVVVKDNLYGLVTYDNEIVVPLQYTYGCVEVNDEGQSFFGDGSMYYVFDKDGNEIFSTTRQIRSVNEGVVCTVDGSDFDARIGYFRLSDGAEIYVNDNLDYIEANAVGFNEGYGFFAMDDPTRIDIEGNTLSFTQVIQQQEAERAENNSNGNVIVDSTGSSVVLAIPIGAMKEGYFSTKGIMATEDSYGRFTVRNAGGTEAYTLDLGSIYNLRGEDIWTSATPFTLNMYFDSGLAFYNYGTIMCATVGDTYYLVDTSKVVDQEYVSVKEEITSGALLTAAEYIGMSGEKYWLIKQDGRWGYIDHAGNVMAMYDDAAAFGDGKALVIEDGTAYEINENYEKVSEIGAAESVSNCGDIFGVIVNGEEFFVAP